MKYTSDIIALLGKVRKKCEKLQQLELEYEEQNLAQAIGLNTDVASLIDRMRQRLDEFEDNAFLAVKKKVLSAVKPLIDIFDCSDLSSIDIDYGLDYLSLLREFEKLIVLFNELTAKLNDIDVNNFVDDNVVSIAAPRKVVSVEDRAAVIAKQIVSYARTISDCADRLCVKFREYFDLNGFIDQVNRDGETTKSDITNQLCAEYEAKLKRAFGGEKVCAGYTAIMTEFDNTVSSVAPKAVAVDRPIPALNLGTVKYPVTDKAHIEYLKNCPPIFNRIDGDGICNLPLIVPIDGNGNVWVDVNSSRNYSKAVNNFLNAAIVNYIASFPVGRVKVVIADVNGRCDFSALTQFCKDTGNILTDLSSLNRARVISDAEHLKYAVSALDKHRSYSEIAIKKDNCKTVFEYNEHAKNPRDYFVFVMTDYGSLGLDRETANKIRSFLNGNEFGVFSIVLKNRYCTKDHYQSAAKNEVPNCNYFTATHGKLWYSSSPRSMPIELSPQKVDFNAVSDLIKKSRSGV